MFFSKAKIIQLLIVFKFICY